MENVLIAAIAGGHVLLEGVPGLGKTLLVHTLAEVLHLSFQPHPVHARSDALRPVRHLRGDGERSRAAGSSNSSRARCLPTSILADQINRGLPKTQSALLQAMEGEAISVAHETFRLPQPFFVMATQNPLEMEGTFPLPEPEIDRFFFKLVVHAARRRADRRRSWSGPRRASRRSSKRSATASGSWRCGVWPAW